MKKNEELIKKTLIIVTVCAIAFLIVQNIGFVADIIKTLLSTLTPLLVGILIAIILGIPLNAIEKKIKKKTKTTRVLCVIGVYILFIALIVLLVVVVLPEFYNSLVKIISNLGSYLGSITEAINELLKKIGLERYSIKIDEIFNVPIADFTSNLYEWISKTPSIEEWLSNFIQSFFKDISNIALMVLSFIVSGLMAIVFSVYILINKETYIRQMKKVFDAFFSDKAANNIKRIVKDAYGTFANFIQGQLVEITILGLLFFIVMSVCGLPYSLLISVIISITAVVPYFGTTLAMIIGALLILADAGLIKMIVFIIIFIVLQQVENNLIYPRIVGPSVGLPGIWVLLSVSVFGELFGIIGLVIGVPLMAIIYTLFKDLVNYRLEKKENK